MCACQWRVVAPPSIRTWRPTPLGAYGATSQRRLERVRLACALGVCAWRVRLACFFGVDMALAPRSSESGRRTKTERRTINAFGDVRAAGAPASFAIEENESPMMIE